VVVRIHLQRIGDRKIETLREGEPIAVSGTFEAEIWAPPGRDPRVNLSLTVDAVISARKSAKAKQRRGEAGGKYSPPTQPALPFQPDDPLGFDDSYAGGDPDDLVRDA